MIYSSIAEQVLSIAKGAGQKILQIGVPKQIISKQDCSPVTEADIVANRYIVQALMQLTPNIPIIAEENTEVENQLIKESPYFWLVDPLDGTRGFIRGESEYTVNIALIKKKHPIGGVIYVPVTDTAYFTRGNHKAYKQIGHQQKQIITTRTVPVCGMTVLSSMLSMGGKTSQFIDHLSMVSEVKKLSSSLKFCMIAEGSADIYPRFGRTMEWDTAAGQAIIEAAGGSVKTLEGVTLTYGKPGFINGTFIARGA